METLLINDRKWISEVVVEVLPHPSLKANQLKVSLKQAFAVIDQDESLDTAESQQVGCLLTVEAFAVADINNPESIRKKIDESDIYAVYTGTQRLEVFLRMTALSAFKDIAGNAIALELANA